MADFIYNQTTFVAGQVEWQSSDVAPVEQTDTSEWLWYYI